MTKKMLIDASHAEETRVVVLDGNRLEDFDVETAGRKQIKGNIYLAKVIRVEPSLQAAFVEYGGNRHGFLAFGEIHPDYYQIPVADRKRLLAQQAEEEAADDEPAEPAEALNTEAAAQDIRPIQIIAAMPPEFDELAAPEAVEPASEAAETSETGAAARAMPLSAEPVETLFAELSEANEAIEAQNLIPALSNETGAHQPEAAAPDTSEPEASEPEASEPEAAEPEAPHTELHEAEAREPAHADMLGHDHVSGAAEAPEPAGPVNFDEHEQNTAELESELAAEPPAPESLGGDGDDAAEARERRQRQRFLRQYKIQEVIHRRQIMLIQVVKEERGSKGAALTTYLSLAGRFSVLMPNSPSGGGVSRKITSVADRRRLKEAVAELDIPDGMGLIVRTAGANQPKPEIKRDCEYLLRLWDDIRERTLESTAPALIYEEASLIKRAIRDVYTREIEDILVDGEEGYRAARDFMRMLMPSQARKVQLWSEGQPLFSKHQVEAQLDAMLNPVVQLRSGGYIVINQTEALVAIDVNSGRATRERNIEDTALRTNLEAAEEAAKQLRMRDLAGLIVIDFIDMESRKNNAAVERRLKDALKNDRARIQVGSISHFGLMEMSRQRLRPSLAEASLMVCPHCAGQGQIRSPESAALHILRAIEDEGAKFRAGEINVLLPAEIAFYLFNHKRDRLTAIEARYAMRVIFTPDASMSGTNFRIEKVKPQTATGPIAPPALQAGQPSLRAEPVAEEPEAEAEAEETVTAEPVAAAETAEEGERKRRRRRRRGKRRGEPGRELAADGTLQEAQESEASDDEAEAEDETAEAALDESGAENSSENASENAAETSPEPAEAAPKRARFPRRRRGFDGEQAPAEPVMQTEPVFADVADIFEAAERAEAERFRLRAEARAAALAATEPAEPAHANGAAPVSEPMAEQAEAAPANAEPLIKPIVIGGDAPAPEKKRGWWRR